MTAKPKTHFTASYITLLLLLAVTVCTAFFHFGVMNIVIALLIAGVQTTVITLYFMHLRVSSHVNWVVAVGSLLWLGILFTLVMGDYATRGWTG